MAVVAEELISDLIVRDGKLKSGLRSAEQTYGQGIGRMRGETKRFEQTAGRSFTNVGKAAVRMFSVLAAGASAKALLNLADAAKQIDAQLRLATQATGSFSQAQADVQRIAAETRVGLKETADLYATFQRNARELGITQEQAARSTETITKAFQISGATAAEAAGGLRQFLQGIQSGVLRGEELNSVLENAPRLARALADGLGVSIGALRAMGQEGELTGERVVAALGDAASSIDAEFRELPVTFDQAMTTLYNSAIITFGAFDEGGEFSKMLANFIVSGSDGFGDMGDSAREFGIDVRSTMAGLSDVFEPLVNAAMEAFSLIGSEADSLADRFRPILGEIDAITKWVSNQGMAGKAIAGGGTNYLQQFNQAQARSESELRRSAGERFVRTINRRYDAMGNPISGGGSTRSAASAGGGGRSRAGRSRAAARSPLNQEAFEREEAALNDQILQLKAEEITNVEGRAAAEVARLQAGRAATEREIQGDKRYTEAQKAQLVALLGTVNAHEQAQVIAERDVQIAEQEIKAREGNLRYYLDALQSQASLETNREERLAIERRILDALEAQEKAELEAAVSAGRIADAAAARADLATTQAARRGGIERDGQSPFQRYANDDGNIRDQAERLVIRKIQDVNDGIASAIANELGVKDQFVKDLFSLFLEETIFRPLAKALDEQGGAGGIGGLFSAVGSVIGGLFGGGRAGGGSVSAGSIYRINESQKEYFKPATSGSIIPLSATAQAARPAGGVAGGPTVVQLAVGPGQLFEPTVEAISGNVSIRTVQAATPGIVQAAGVNITRRSQRPRV